MCLEALGQVDWVQDCCWEGDCVMSDLEWEHSAGLEEAERLEGFRNFLCDSGETVDLLVGSSRNS